MTSEKFVAWVTKQQKTIQIYLDQGLTTEAHDLASEALEYFKEHKSLADNGLQQFWSEKFDFFQNLLKQAQDLKEKNNDDSLEDDVEETATQEYSAQGHRSRGEALFDVGEYDKAIADLRQAYEKGLKSYGVIFLILECLNKKGRINEQIEFINQSLEEATLREEEKAKLFYRLGLIYLHFEKKSQARQALWQVKRIDPDFPGLEQKLKPLEEEKGESKSKYDLLIKEGKIDRQTLDKVFAEARLRKEDPDQVLIDEYGIAKVDLGNSLSDFYNVAYVAFDPTIEPPFELFEKKKLDPDFLKKSQWVPFAQYGRDIEILMVDPFDMDKLGEIKFLFETGNVVPKVALAEDINQFVESFYRALSADRELSALGEELNIDALDENIQHEMDLEEEALTAGDSEVVRLVNALLIEAWRKGVSDIHIEPNPRNRYCMIRFREDGSCHEYRKIRFGLSRPLVSRIKIMAHLDIAERRLPQDGKVKIKLPDRNRVVEYRVATLPTVEGQEDVVLRVLASGKPLPLERLGLLENNLNEFKECIYKPYGMILCVGPTGSGKTTTLHSAMSYINTPERKIWTAEDPVEITQEGLRQVQVKPKIGLTFASSLRAFLRADPDVVMIGEMRDPETAQIGVEASLTGHLVLSTLHTNSAPETITRLLDMKIDPFNFADSLICVLAQRLMKTLCDNCKEAYEPTEDEIKNLKREFGPGFEEHSAPFLAKDDFKLYRAKGCNQCNQGYRGRIGVHELMINTGPIKVMIKTRKPTEDIREEAVKNGMLTLKQDGIMKVLHGMADIKQVRAVAAS